MHGPHELWLLRSASLNNAIMAIWQANLSLSPLALLAPSGTRSKAVDLYLKLDKRSFPNLHPRNGALDHWNVNILGWCITKYGTIKSTHKQTGASVSPLTDSFSTAHVSSPHKHLQQISEPLVTPPSSQCFPPAK